MKAHRILYHSTLGLRVVKKKKRKRTSPGVATPAASREALLSSMWSSARSRSEVYYINPLK